MIEQIDLIGPSTLVKSLNHTNFLSKTQQQSFAEGADA